MAGKERLIKSRQRVKDFAEVYTPERIVKDMLDLIPEDACQIDSTYLEPACGNGNFLAEIFRRKLERCRDEKDGLVALASIYGVDIQEDNVQESRERLYDMFRARFGEHLLAGIILCHNITCGDALTGKHPDGTQIDFLEGVEPIEVRPGNRNNRKTASRDSSDKRKET